MMGETPVLEVSETSDAAALLRTYLSERDDPCPGCGYNLRGLTGERCPECGQALVLRVGLAEPKLAAWIAGLIGLAASAGFSGLFLVISVVITLRDLGPGPPTSIWLQFVLGLVISLGLLLGWVKSRRALQQASVGARSVGAALVWLVPSVNVVSFIWLLP